MDKKIISILLCLVLGSASVTCNVQAASRGGKASRLIAGTLAVAGTAALALCWFAKSKSAWARSLRSNFLWHLCDNRDQGLRRAIYESTPEWVQAWVNDGANVDIGLECSETPMLEYAICRGDVDIIRILLEAGANANNRCNNGDPLLYFAIQEGNAAIVRELLEAGADPHAIAGGRYPQPMPMICHAINLGSNEIVKTLVEYKPDILYDYALTDSKNPFFCAAWNAVDRGSSDRLELLRYLADLAEDAETLDMMYGEVLLRDSGNAMQILLAASEKHDFSISKEALLIRAIEGGKPSCMRELIKSGANIDADEGTPLFKAIISGGATQISKLLLEAGANPNVSKKCHYSVCYDAVTREGAEETPLEYVVKHCPRGKQKERTVVLLLKKGATPVPTIIAQVDRKIDDAVLKRSLMRELARRGAPVSSDVSYHDLQKIEQKRFKTIVDVLHNDNNMPKAVVDHCVLPFLMPAEQLERLQRG